MKKWGFVFVLITLFMQCATLEKIVEPPSVNIQSVNITDATFEDITLNFKLQVKNPNPFGVSMQGFDYSLVIEDNEFLSGTRDQEISIAGATTGEFGIPLKLQFQEIWDLAQKLKALDSLSFALTGTVKPSGVFSGMSLPFSYQGKVPNVRIPKLEFGGLQVKEMGFSGVDLELSLGLDNPNSFSFDIGELDYVIEMGGKKVADGFTEQLASVPAKGGSFVKIPLSLRFTNMGSMIRELLDKGNVDVTVKGATSLDTPFGEMSLPINTTQNVNVLR